MTHKSEKRLFVAIGILASLGLILMFGYLKRQDLRERYDRWRLGPLPAEMTFNDAFPSYQPPSVETPPAEAAAPVAPPPNFRPPTAPPPAPAVAPTPEAVKPTTATAALPAEANLKVIFIPQAPFKIWDAIHDDACEEAAVLMLQAYVNRETSLSLEEMDRRILDLVQYQNDTLGYFESTDAATTVQFMRDRLNLPNARAVALTSPDDIRRQIVAGHPVALPTDGRALKNPNFRNGGPVYHMVVVKGFMKDKFITNDPGTRKGADYVYDAKLLWGAIADYRLATDTVDNKAKYMILAE